MELVRQVYLIRATIEMGMKYAEAMQFIDAGYPVSTSA
jgi:hypothetical protein